MSIGPLELAAQKRLRMEPLEMGHAELLFAELADPELVVFTPAQPPTTASNLALEFERLARGSQCDEAWRNWVMFERDLSLPIGTLQATISPNGTALIAYTVFRRFWRRGFASEGVSWLLGELNREHGVTNAVALIDTRNVASIRLVEKLGFDRVALEEDADHFKGETSHEYRYERRLV